MSTKKLFSMCLLCGSFAIGLPELFAGPPGAGGRDASADKGRSGGPSRASGESRAGGGARSSGGGNSGGGVLSGGNSNRGGAAIPGSSGPRSGGSGSSGAGQLQSGGANHGGVAMQGSSGARSSAGGNTGAGAVPGGGGNRSGVPTQASGGSKSGSGIPSGGSVSGGANRVAPKSGTHDVPTARSNNVPPTAGKPSSGSKLGSESGRTGSSFTERHSTPKTGAGSLPTRKAGDVGVPKQTAGDLGAPRQKTGDVGVPKQKAGDLGVPTRKAGDAGSSNDSFLHRHADSNADKSGRGKPDVYQGVPGNRAKAGTTNRTNVDPDLKLSTDGKPSSSVPPQDSFLKRHNAHIGNDHRVSVPNPTIDHHTAKDHAANHSPPRQAPHHDHAAHHDHAHAHRATIGLGSPFGLYLGSHYRYGYPWGIVGSRFYVGLPLFAYRPVCSYGYSGYGGYGGYSSVSTYYAYQPSVVTNYIPPAAQPVIAAEDSESVDAEGDFVALGEAAFQAGKYDAAARNWRHALVDDPDNGTLVLLLGQALFAGGKYDEAAGAIQHAIQILPEEKWGVVVSNYKELYPNMQEYTNQLRVAEAARDKKDSPAVRFLLGYHYGFLGYPKNAVRELDKTLELAPADEIAKKLRDVLAAKLKPAEAPAATPAPPRE